MNEKTNDQILTSGLREALKAVMQKEIDRLPEVLEGLEPKERIAFVCRLMPFVFPKVEPVRPTEGEPMQW
jgi:hypothetical protein